MMRHLLLDHPLLAPYARHPNVAIDWAAQVAAAQGLTVAQAQERLAFCMEANAQGADPDGPACDRGHDHDG